MVAPAAAIQAVSALRNAENGALGGGTSFYTGTGRDDGEGKVQGKKKSKAAIFTILMLLFGGGAFLGSSHSLLAPAIEALFTEATDTQYTSSALRAPRLMKFSLANNATTTTWKGTQKYTAMSSGFKKRLARNGIEVEGFGSNRVLNFTNKDGVTKTVTANDFLSTFTDDVDFRDSYTSAKRGRVANFFDKIADKIYQKLGLSRNMFSKFRQTSDSDIDAANYRDTMTDKFEGNTSDTKGVVKKDYEVDEHNDPNDPSKVTGSHTETRTEQVNGDSATTSGTEVQTGKARDMLTKIAGAVGQVGTIACTVLRVGGMISVMVAANEIYQSINYFMGLTENVSKMKAGYGDSSALNEVLNFMTTSAHTVTSNTGEVQLVGSGETKAGELEQTGSPVEANGMQMVLAGAPSTTTTNKAFSLERVRNSVLTALSMTGTSLVACNLLEATEAVVSIGVTIASFGTAKIVGAILNAVKSVAISLAITAVLGFAIPAIAKTLFTNAFETATGIPAGELFTKGASAANTRVGRNGSGQSVSSKSVALAYNRDTQAVLAMDAEIDRKNHSPFDITNHNTFLGTIAYSLLPTFTSSKMTSVSSFVRSTSKSLATIISPTVRADGEGSSYMTTFGDCPALNDIGAVGDIYCNPVTTTDTRVEMIDLDPNDATYGRVINDAMEDCTDAGDCTISKNSDLAKYITYCDNRDSPFGMLDQNILGDLQTSNKAGGLKGFLNALPLIGDLISLIDSAQDITNASWASGEKCGNTEKNSTFWNTKGKYYQRYIEDMRILDGMGAFDEGGQNPVAKYEAEYEAEHPLDNSYEGYLSRISGLTKENVETVLAFVDYYQYLEKYDPSSRIAHFEAILRETPASDVVARIETNHPYIHSADIIEDDSEPVILANKHIIYADLRTLNFAA